jgi:choline dehydrogenase-like flavoprotein
MLPTVHCIPDQIEIPRRLLRRGQLQRMKARAARFWQRWHGRQDALVKSRMNGVPEYYTARELQAVIGKNATMHCTHICGMCKFEKRFGVQKNGHPSRRIVSLDHTIDPFGV